MSDKKISLAADSLAAAKKVGVLTGAGVSVASGVPAFRGPQGVWNRWKVEDLATPEAFHRNPKLVWEWYEWRREQIARCRPNRAHAVLAAWSQRFPEFTLVTQNVDGLHELAETRSVVRYHGSIWELRCVRNCGPAYVNRQVPLASLPPACACGALVRPGVVWFGEAIPDDVLARAEAATHSDVFLSIGTSSLVYPAAGLLSQASRNGAFTIEINPTPTPLAAGVDLAIHGPAEAVLDRIEARIAPPGPSPAP